MIIKKKTKSQTSQFLRSSEAQFFISLKYKKLTRCQTRLLYSLEISETGDFIGPKSLKDTISELQNKYLLLDDERSEKTRHQNIQAHARWVEIDREVTLSKIREKITEPLLNIWLIFQKKRVYMVVFRLYVHIRYPFFRFTNPLKPKDLDFIKNQLKLRYQFLGIVDVEIQALFQILCRWRDSAIHVHGSSRILKTITSLYITHFVYSRLLFMLWHISCEKLIFLINSIEPSALRQCLYSFYISAFPSVITFCLIGFAVFFLSFCYNLKKTESSLLALFYFLILAFIGLSIVIIFFKDPWLFVMSQFLVYSLRYADSLNQRS
jgi:hypothetical protein